MQMKLKTGNIARLRAGEILFFYINPNSGCNMMSFMLMASTSMGDVIIRDPLAVKVYVVEVGHLSTGPP